MVNVEIYSFRGSFECVFLFPGAVSFCNHLSVNNSLPEIDRERGREQRERERERERVVSE